MSTCQIVFRRTCLPSGGVYGSHKELDKAYAATEAAFSRVTIGQILRSESKIIPLCDI